MEKHTSMHKTCLRAGVGQSQTVVFIHFVHNRTFHVKMVIQNELISTIHLENKNQKSPLKMRSLLSPVIAILVSCATLTGELHSMQHDVK